MKLLIALALSLLFSACAPGGRGASTLVGNPVPPTPRPGPAPGSELEWGESPCQRRGDCRDPVLNQSLIRLGAFLAKDRGAVPAGEAAPFFCGRRLGRAWENELGGDGFDGQISKFLLEVIDPSACRARSDWQLVLRQYFVNHQEYGK